MLDGKLFVLGGLNQRDYTLPVEEYDPIGDTWIIRGSIPAQYKTAVVAMNDELYVVAGEFHDTTAIPSLASFDPATGRLTQHPAPPTPRVQMEAAMLDGRLYVLGGLNYRDGILSTVEAFDPVTETWATVAPMPRGRRAMAVAALDGLLYVIGGEARGGPGTYVSEIVASVIAYDPKTDTMSVLWNDKRSPVSTNTKSVIGMVWTTANYRDPYHYVKEENNVGPCVDTTNPVLADDLLATGTGARLEVVFVDDGSRDGSAEVIRGNAHAAVDELQEVLHLLRAESAETNTSEPASLLPRIEDLDVLVADAAASGQTVGVRNELDAAAVGELRPQLHRTAYRTVQEGLTNARKHAPGAPVTVRLTGAPGSELTIEVTNPTPQGVSAGAGIPVRAFQAPGGQILPRVSIRTSPFRTTGSRSSHGESRTTWIGAVACRKMALAAVVGGFNPAALAQLPTDHKSGGPYIMWQNSPYAHVMMPVK